MRDIYIALDVETTGLDAKKHVICQLGATIFDRDSIFVSQAWDVYVSPQQFNEASDEALKVTKFTPQRMRAGRPIEHVLTAVQLLHLAVLKEQGINHAYLSGVFHNAPFDVAFLQAAAEKTPEVPDITRNSGRKFFKDLTRRVLDTVTMAWLADGCTNTLRAYSLREVADKFLTEADRAEWKQHDAGDDSRITALITQEIIRTR